MQQSLFTTDMVQEFMRAEITKMIGMEKEMESYYPLALIIMWLKWKMEKTIQVRLH